MSEANVVKHAGTEGVARDDAYLLPPVDVVEDAGGITLYADLPGVTRDKLVLQVDGENLVIEGEIVLAQAEGLEPTHVEVSVPRYRRVFTLSRELDSDKVDARLEAGVLTLRIPKAEHAQARKVEITVA